jgi:hypothetical protein
LGNIIRDEKMERFAGLDIFMEGKLISNKINGL